jgi:hypothetical protein
MGRFACEKVKSGSRWFMRLGHSTEPEFAVPNLGQKRSRHFQTRSPDGHGANLNPIHCSCEELYLCTTVSA